MAKAGRFHYAAKKKDPSKKKIPSLTFFPAGFIPPIRLKLAATLHQDLMKKKDKI